MGKNNSVDIYSSISRARYVRLSPTKARLIAREVQGLSAEVALASLEFSPNKAAKYIYKTLASAIANSGMDATNLKVVSCRVDGGPVLKRFRPRARGRATPIRKPMSHIYVEVRDASKVHKKNGEVVDNGSEVE